LGIQVEVVAELVEWTPILQRLEDRLFNQHRQVEDLVMRVHHQMYLPKAEGEEAALVQLEICTMEEVDLPLKLDREPFALEEAGTTMVQDKAAAPPMRRVIQETEAPDTSMEPEEMAVVASSAFATNSNNGSLFQIRGY